MNWINENWVASNNLTASILNASGIDIWNTKYSYKSVKNMFQTHIYSLIFFSSSLHYCNVVHKMHAMCMQLHQLYCVWDVVGNIENEMKWNELYEQQHIENMSKTEEKKKRQKSHKLTIKRWNFALALALALANTAHSVNLVKSNTIHDRFNQPKTDQTDPDQTEPYTNKRYDNKCIYSKVFMFSL